MLNKLFFVLTVVLLAGCCSVQQVVPESESDSSGIFEIGCKVVESVISGNFSDFAAAAGETHGERTEKEFSDSRRELIRNYGELCSFRHFGELETPLFANLFFAVKFKRAGNNGKYIEHEQLMQLLFGKKDDSWQLIGMRFI